MRIKTNSKKRIFLFITIGLVLVISLVVLSLLSGKFTKAKNIQVAVNDSGFSSQIVFIKKGQTVDFVIGGVREHWPASNSHPTHKEYPSATKGCIGSSLDACRGMHKGEVYSFKFDKIGIWGMHDHLFPGFTMIIVVSDKQIFPQDQQTNNVKIPPAGDFKNLNYVNQQLVIKTLASRDPSLAWKYLKDAVAVDRTMKNVHELAHIVGNELYKKNGFKGIVTCSHDFGFACYHGVTEEMFLQNGPASLSSIESQCDQAFGGTAIEDLRCIHGMGHGLITYNNLDVRKALPQCEQLKKEHKEVCYIGVYMGYASDAPKDVFDAANPWKFCSSFPVQYRKVCAEFIPTFLFKLVPFNQDVYKNICNGLPEEQYIQACLIHVPERITPIVDN